MARLAARLTGWHIDIKSASFAGEPLVADTSLIDEPSEEESEDGLCAFEAEDGTRCRNHARPGYRYCGHPCGSGGRGVAWQTWLERHVSEPALCAEKATRKAIYFVLFVRLKARLYSTLRVV